jgi:organic radical activating enzyme
VDRIMAALIETLLGALRRKGPPTSDPALDPDPAPAPAIVVSPPPPSPPQPLPPPPARYLSCRFLERAITFYPGQVTACCANPATGKTPILALMKTGELPVDSFLAARQRIIGRHKNGRIHENCQHCPRLTEEEWERPGALSPYAVDEVTIAHFTSCNIRCNYCYTVTRPELTAPLSKQPRILPTFQQLIEQKLLAPDATVRFSGGEPTLSPEFEPLLKLLTDYGVRSVVYTNATKRSDAIMDALAKDKIELVLGIDATTVQTYKAIKKMNYNEKVWKVVAEYCGALPRDAANKVWAKFIFCVENYHEAAHFVERAHAAGARNVYYDFDSSRTVIGAERAGVHLPEEICDHLAVLRHGCEKRGIVVEFAQSGLAWLTPEREARVEREIARLRQQDASAAA